MSIECTKSEMKLLEVAKEFGLVGCAIAFENIKYVRENDNLFVHISILGYTDKKYRNEVRKKAMKALRTYPFTYELLSELHAPVPVIIKGCLIDGLETKSEKVLREFFKAIYKYLPEVRRKVKLQYIMGHIDETREILNVANTTEDSGYNSLIKSYSFTLDKIGGYSGDTNIETIDRYIMFKEAIEDSVGKYYNCVEEHPHYKEYLKLKKYVYEGGTI